MICLSGMPNASIPTPQPVKQRKQFGAYGRAVGNNSVVFVSQVSLATNTCKFIIPGINCVRLTRGLCLVDTWSVFGWHVVCVWLICGLCLVDTWSVFGWYLVSVWLPRGLCLVDMWSVVGWHVVCVVAVSRRARTLAWWASMASVSVPRLSSVVASSPRLTWCSTTTCLRSQVSLQTTPVGL